MGTSLVDQPPKHHIDTMRAFIVILATVAVANADFIGHNNRGGQQPRTGRQENAVPGGVDFSGCQNDPETGLCCVEKIESVTTLQKDPILECTHKNVEKCHYTYVTQFTPAQEEVCDETFEKSCSITFKQQAFEDKVNKCYTPVEKVCNGQGEDICQTVYESACTTKYVEKQPGKFVGDTKCEKLPVEICGAGCVTEEGPEECHDKVVTSLLDVPEEVCDLNPQKTCKFQTKLVPRLKPAHECTIIPRRPATSSSPLPKRLRSRSRPSGAWTTPRLPLARATMRALLSANPLAKPATTSPSLLPSLATLDVGHKVGFLHPDVPVECHTLLFIIYLFIDTNRKTLHTYNTHT